MQTAQNGSSYNPVTTPKYSDLKFGVPEHSRRILPTRRSQKAFAWGTWNGVFKTLKPIDFRVESNSQE